MNPDKFNTLTSNLVSFIAGERPSADKFNAVNKYFSRSLNELAKVVGPIYDKSFPYFDVSNGRETYMSSPYNVFDAANTSRPLDIVNLARLIGPASNLNARILSGAETITETVPAGVTSYRFKYTVNTIPTPSNYNVMGTDYQTIYFDSPTNAPADYTYNTVDYASHHKGGPNYAYSGFNVIPDPNHITDNNLPNNLDITYNNADSSYTINLPVVKYQQSGLNNLSSSLINSNDEPHNQKQLKLPEWMWNSTVSNTTNILFTANTEIPSNFLYLKNRTTGEVYLDARYVFMSSTQIKVFNIDLCLGENPEHKFCIITVGTDITTSIDDLRLKWFKHSHDGTFGEAPVDIKDLAGIFVKQAPNGIFRPSSINTNHLPMYLHRDGYQVDSTHCNANNAMRGDLVMGLTSFDPLVSSSSIYGNSTTTETESHGIYFGTDQAKILRNDQKALLIANEVNEVLNGIELRTNSKIFIDSANDTTIDSEDNIILTGLNGFTVSTRQSGTPNNVANQTGVIEAEGNLFIEGEAKLVLESNSLIENHLNNDLYEYSGLNNNIDFQNNEGVNLSFEKITQERKTLVSKQEIVNRTLSFQSHPTLNLSNGSVYEWTANPSGAPYNFTRLGSTADGAADYYSISFNENFRNQFLNNIDNLVKYEFINNSTDVFHFYSKDMFATYGLDKFFYEETHLNSTMKIGFFRQDTSFIDVQMGNGVGDLITLDANLENNKIINIYRHVNLLRYIENDKEVRSTFYIKIPKTYASNNATSLSEINLHYGGWYINDLPSFEDHSGTSGSSFYSVNKISAKYSERSLSSGWVLKMTTRLPNNSSVGNNHILNLKSLMFNQINTNLISIIKIEEIYKDGAVFLDITGVE